MALKGGENMDILHGEVTVTTTGTLILPIPSTYFFCAWLKRGVTPQNSTLTEIVCDVRKKAIQHNNTGRDGWFINRSNDAVTVSASNSNTTGTVDEGDTYCYIAWKENEI